jgi:hypothetical protein
VPWETVVWLELLRAGNAGFVILAVTTVLVWGTKPLLLAIASMTAMFGSEKYSKRALEVLDNLSKNAYGPSDDSADTKPGALLSAAADEQKGEAA